MYFTSCLLSLCLDTWKIPAAASEVSDETESAAVVTWETIEGLPDNIKQYYKYILEYRVNGDLDYTVFKTVNHDPDGSNKQQETLTGLEYGQVYDVRVRSVRKVGDQIDDTGNTADAQLTTKCKRYIHIHLQE